MRWAPLYLAALATALLSPLAFGAAPKPFSWRPVPSDLVLNTLALVPLGWALRSRGVWVSGLAGIGLALLAEWAQRYLPRNPNFWDVAANGAGALLGAWLGPPRQAWTSAASRLRRPGPILLAGAVIAVGLVTFGASRLRPTDFSNWEDFPLVFGVEELGEQRWGGRLRSLAIYERTPVAARAGATALLQLQGVPGPRLVLSAFGKGDTLAGSLPAAGFQVTERGLLYGPGAWRLPDTIAHRLRAQLVSAGRLTILAELESPPAPDPRARRILALSAGHPRRDFVLGQLGERLYFQVRTPRFPAGRVFTVSPPAHGVFQLTATADRYWVRLQAQPGDEREWFLPAEEAPWPLGAGVTLSFGVVVVLTGLGTAVNAPRRLRGVAVVCGTLLGLALWAATGIFRLHPADPLTLGFPLLAWSTGCFVLLRRTPSCP